MLPHTLSLALTHSHTLSNTLPHALTDSYKRAHTLFHTLPHNLSNTLPRAFLTLLHTLTHAVTP